MSTLMRFTQSQNVEFDADRNEFALRYDRFHDPELC